MTTFEQREERLFKIVCKTLPKFGVRDRERTLIIENRVVRKAVISSCKIFLDIRNSEECLIFCVYTLNDEISEIPIPVRELEFPVEEVTEALILFFAEKF